MAERIQKLLASAGLGSRREIERWIAAGRVRVNGAPPGPGHRIDSRDRVTLDGRPVRLQQPVSAESALLLLHRSPGERLDIAQVMSDARRAGIKAAGRRWLAVLPLPPVDGGLEILTDHGPTAQRIARRAHALEVEFILRARGPVSAALIEELLASTEIENEPMCITAASFRAGGASNHWISCTVRSTRPSQIRHWLGARGVIVSRLMRIAVGAVKLGRDLPRGRLRAMTARERAALLRDADASEPVETARRKTVR